MVIFPGGMEELSLEQIKKRSDLEEDIDFENGVYLFTFIVLIIVLVETFVVISSLYLFIYIYI